MSPCTGNMLIFTQIIFKLHRKIQSSKEIVSRLFLFGHTKELQDGEFLKAFSRTLFFDSVTTEVWKDLTAGKNAIANKTPDGLLAEAVKLIIPETCGATNQQNTWNRLLKL